MGNNVKKREETVRILPNITLDRKEADALKKVQDKFKGVDINKLVRRLILDEANRKKE